MGSWRADLIQVQWGWCNSSKGNNAFTAGGDFKLGSGNKVKCGEQTNKCRQGKVENSDTVGIKSLPDALLLPISFQNKIVLIRFRF